MTIIDNIDISVLLKAKGGKIMKHVINVRKTALEIVQVLHQNEVPITSIQFVFQEAERLASIKTVPYSPSSDEIQEAVTCDTTDNGTVPNG